MKGYSYSLIWLVIIFIALLGCGKDAKEEKELDLTPYETVNNFEGVTMTVKEGTITPEKLTVIFENQSEKQATYGDDYFLEQKIEGNWHQVPVIQDSYGFDSIGYEISPSEIQEFTIDWEWLYGELKSGKYRIIKSVLDTREPGDFDEYHLAAQFTID